MGEGGSDLHRAVTREASADAPHFVPEDDGPGVDRGNGGPVELQQLHEWRGCVEVCGPQNVLQGGLRDVHIPQPEALGCARCG